MSKLLTYLEAQTRFANVATTGISIAAAIQEAVDTIYDMGRWPGTTREIALTDADFTLDSESGEYTVSFTESDYNGAIGFRNRQRGWSIVDQGMLYKDGVNAGDAEFVDLGTVSVTGLPTLSVSGSIDDGTDPVVFPSLLETSVAGNYSSDGETEAPASGDWYEYRREVGTCALRKFVDGSITAEWEGFEAASPEDTTNWAPVSVGATGTPVFTLNESPSVLVRRYRCPLDWSLEGGPYFALMKLESPTLAEDTLIPVESIKALKCAIEAVCYEYVSDKDRSMACWQEFEMFMGKSEKQVHGPKRLTMGMDSSLRRRPSQFS